VAITDKTFIEYIQLETIPLKQEATQRMPSRENPLKHQTLWGRIKSYNIWCTLKKKTDINGVHILRIGNKTVLYYRRTGSFNITDEKH
jgi:hypothetical protein